MGILWRADPFGKLFVGGKAPPRWPRWRGTSRGAGGRGGGASGGRWEDGEGRHEVPAVRVVGRGGALLDLPDHHVVEDTGPSRRGPRGMGGGH